MAERKKTLNEKDSILDLEDQARNAKQLLDRLNKAAYGMTWEEYTRLLCGKEDDKHEKPNH